MATKPSDAPAQPGSAEGETLLLHASCVAFEMRNPAADAARWSGVLIRAPSGGGKSAFALRLIALGARLVADDQTLLKRGAGGALVARAPDAVRGVIEARGLGLIRLPALSEAPIGWIVDLKIGGAEGRLPAPQSARILEIETPLLTLSEDERAASALCCLVRDGALLDPEADLADFRGGEVGGDREN